MNDSWYDEYMFEIACPSEYLSDEMREGLETEPIVLPAWDPMGSLARDEALS
jgi:bleomycin hydrolase